MAVTFFRPRKPGPEIAVEDAVVDRLNVLFPPEGRALWTAGSVPIGAGRPDLVVVSCTPKVYALAQMEMSPAQILGYLRVVGRARLETIVERVGHHEDAVVRCLEGLREVEAIRGDSDVYHLSPEWRDILPEIVTIEAKVTDWRRAVSQAGRNRVFAHRSFVALPETVAKRVRRDPIFPKLGLGILGVGDDNDVRVVRQARRRRPCVWTYYYQLACIVANNPKGASDAVCSTSFRCPKGLS
jgi:hypothetical protein